MENLGTEKELKQKPSFFKSKLFWSILIVLVLGIGITGYLVKQSNLAKVEKMENEYKSNLTDIVENINNSYEKAQPMTKLFSDMWSITIKSDVYDFQLAKALNLDESKILEHIPDAKLNPRGHYIKKGDFNTGIAFIYNLKEDDGTIGELEKSREEIKSQMNNLKNPPEKYEVGYKEVLQFYSTYEKYIDLAISPKGSYNSYTDDITSIAMEIENQYRTLQVSLP
ncbi:hypothetical protein NKR17_17275 [Priestia flexa]|uniref:hypothetical protein n=1 Tax=Priestia flexa TaxID=86664 RepID=UPI00209FFC5F|nr:hypothetical protein [Priestia flexa]MCP1190801.1 hypothetical protein [Priestia flexa]